MDFLETNLQDVKLIKLKVFEDQRGFFLESYSRTIFERNGITSEFVQDNHSLSVVKGTLRGLHFQRPPHAQAKLIRIVRGEAYDVVVDLRRSSPTFGKWEAFILSEKNFTMLYVPKGFAHGFCTLTPNTEMIYKVDNFYSPQFDGGIRWNDPDLAICWPEQNPILSEKDSMLPFLKELESPF